MPATRLLTLTLTAVLTTLVCAAPLPVLVRNGEAHVAAAVLEREAGMVVGAVRCIVDREAGGLDALRARGYDAQALFGAGDLGLADHRG